MKEFLFPLDHSAMDIARRAYRKALEPVCLEWELTQTELDVLLFLHNTPQFDRAADVVARRGLQKSHVSLSVSDLVWRRMLKKIPDPADRRSARLELTERGRLAAQDGRDAQERFYRQLVQGIPEEDLACFRNTIERILRNMEMLKERSVK